MLERRGWRAAAVTAAIAAAVMLLLAATAAADPATAEEGVLGSFETSPAAALSLWTPARRDDAEPLPVRTLAGPAPTASAPAAEGASTAVAAPTPTARAIEGVDTGDSTRYPNSANGKIYGIYEFGGKRRGYECSGSVVSSPRGNVVLTAGHCVIDPETGTVAKDVVFIPGFRRGAEPFGAWAATMYTTTEAWRRTVGTAVPDEGDDLAFLLLRGEASGRNVEEAVGALGIAFDQSRSQAYTEYGYPAESPYDGEVLYSHTAAYAGSDTNPGFSPRPIRIASDFTGGASGGPWTIGPDSAPTIVSLTDYGYESQPGYLYGAYFGEAARSAYELASGETATGGIEDSGEVPATGTVTPTQSPPAVAPSTVTPAGTTQTATATSTTSPAPADSQPGPAQSSLRIAVRARRDGSAAVIATVDAAGTLTLSGPAVRAGSVAAPAAGDYRLLLAARGGAARALRRDGHATVTITVTFAAPGGSLQASRQVHLRRR